MPLFFKEPLGQAETVSIHIFAPPASGENDASQGEDWVENYYCKMTMLPELRIRYEAVEQVQ